MKFFNRKKVSAYNSIILKKYPQILIEGDIEAGGYCIIDSRVHGLFACFYCIVYGLYICREEGLKPIIVLGDNHVYYEKKYGENVFEYFFDQQVKAPAGMNLPKIIVQHPDTFLNWPRISTAEKVIAHSIIEQYFSLNASTANAINSFVDAHFAGHRVLGIHYRGRDKITEAPLLDFEFYLQKVRYMMAHNLCDKIFFCTDELNLRDEMAKLYGDKVVMYGLEANYEKALQDKTAGLHFATDTNYLQAKDAFMECYLLSKCTMLMSSHKSSMSMFATFFNPEIVHIVLEP